MKLKKLEINQFKNFGFLKIKNFINKKKLKELRNEVNKLSKSKNKIIAKYYQQNYLKTKDDLFRIEHFYEGIEGGCLARTSWSSRKDHSRRFLESICDLLLIVLTESQIT